MREREREREINDTVRGRAEESKRDRAIEFLCFKLGRCVEIKETNIGYSR